MKIVGIKYTHDAAVAMIEDGVLRFSVEMEKIGNRQRRTKMLFRQWLDDALKSEGVDLGNVDAIAVDGWKRDRMRFGLKAAGYNEYEDDEFNSRPVLSAERYEDKLTESGGAFSYSSYTHTAGHLIGSYALSPFAGQDAVLITWDGGTSAQAYLVEQGARKLTRLGVVVDICGSVYGNMGLYFGPFRDSSVIDSPEIPFRRFGDVAWPGKLMARVAFGVARPQLLDVASKAYEAIGVGPNRMSDDSVREHQFLRMLRGTGFSDDDVLMSIHEFLSMRLLSGVKALCPAGLPLVLSGGSFLNIKWNAALRESGHFSGVWAPPVVNDTGSAIGAAACELLVRTGHCKINWRVHAGPRLVDAGAATGWTRSSVDAAGIARVIASGNPVIVLRDRAEIGPRALGGRSILSDPRDAAMKDRLNAAKRREQWHPVAPIVLEHRSCDVFSPGGRDSFMLFEHTVRHAWRSIIPAAVHVDGSARMQTVSKGEDEFIANVLEEFEVMTGCPVLLNTSANLRGSGFFDSLRDATEWAGKAGINHVVAQDTLWRVQ